MLEIHFLGDFRLFYNSSLVTTIVSGRLQSLLAYLILHRDAPQPRRRIASLLWPDSSETQARTNLRNLLHVLRQALPDADNYLCLAGSTIQWMMDSAFTLDVADLEAAIGCRAFEAVVAIYTGDLLPDCYDEWVVDEREQLRKAYLDALEQLIQQKESEYDYHMAIDYAQRLIHYEPLQEQSYQKLMRVYALSGDRLGVIRTYNVCVSRLQDQLGVEPSERTQKEYEACLSAKAVLYSNISLAAPTPNIFPKNNLPPRLSRFIGREREKHQINQLLAAHRLVTLTGPSGIGKTRLAIQIAQETEQSYKHGAWLVDLTSVSRPELVPITVATALGIQNDNDAVLPTLLNYLHEKSILLILDNCEHLIDACASLSENLILRCPKLHILVTSREALGVNDEEILYVPSLSLPAKGNLSVNEIEKSDAVQLFVEHANTELPGFKITEVNKDAIAQVCRQLDGIALAIELAAARIKIMDIRHMAARLDDIFRLIGEDNSTTLPHHKTLKATFDWSCSLLSDVERILLHRLAVFAGGWSLDAMETVCSDHLVPMSIVLDALMHLVNKSLVFSREQGDETRCYLLEITRQYAQEKLAESGDYERMRECHLDYYFSLSESIKPRLRSAEWLHSKLQMRNEWDNFRKAMEWSIKGYRPDSAAKGLQVALVFRLIMLEDGSSQAECIMWLQKIIEKIANTDAAVNILRAEALCAIGRWHYSTGNGDLGCSMVKESVALYRADPLINPCDLAEALSNLVEPLWNQGDPSEALMLAKESVAICRSLGQLALWQLACSLWESSWAFFSDKQFEIAQSQAIESRIIYEQLGDFVHAADCFHMLGYMASSLKDYEKARSYYEKALVSYRKAEREFGDALSRRIYFVIGELARVDRLTNNVETARTRLEELLSYCRVKGDPHNLIWSLRELGRTMLALGDQTKAIEYLREGLLRAKEMKSGSYKGTILVIFAEIFYSQKRFPQAACILGALDSQPKVGWSLYARNAYEETLDVIRASYRDESFAQIYSVGQRMSVDQAVIYTLEAAI
jgi:predicted ATPase/DNA-binding SARP family transcriptional activator